MNFCSDNPVADQARQILLGNVEGSTTPTGLIVDNETASSLGNNISANQMSAIEQKKFA
jgi:hypothetical protein